MNKYLKIGLFTILAGAGSAAAAEDGTITFDGTISDATCIITGGDAQGESTSPDFTVHRRCCSNQGTIPQFGDLIS